MKSMSVVTVQQKDSYVVQFYQGAFLNPLKKVADLITRLVKPIFNWLAHTIGWRIVQADSVSANQQPPVLVTQQQPAEPPVLNQVCGLRNRGMNCAFNSVAQFLNSDPVLAEWFRNPLTAEMTLQEFEQFLAGYNPGQELIDQFRLYVGNQPQNPPPIPILFRTFLNENRQTFRNLHETYESLIRIQEPFSQFFDAYDQAVQGNLDVAAAADSQRLRLAVHQVNQQISESPYVQEDAPEILTSVLNVLPNEQHICIQESYHYNTEGMPAIQGCPDGISVKPPENQGYLTLEIKSDNQPPRLDQMIADYFDHDIETGDGVRFQGVDGVERRYIPDHCSRTLLRTPTALRFQIKRFYVEEPPRTWLTRWLPNLFPHLPYKTEKRETPVEVPDEITLTLADGTRQRFQLTSFINQHGSSMGSGHYTCSRIIDNQRYMLDDSRVSPIDEINWEENLKRAYLICYLPIEG